MKAPLAINGLIPVEEFPATPYNRTYLAVKNKWGDHPAYEHFVGSWSTASQRFHAAVSALTEFSKSVQEAGSFPAPTERYRQDQALTNFFGNAFSTFESTFFALYSLGVFLSPVHFSLASPKAQRQVSPNNTLATFRSALPGSSVVPMLEALLADPSFTEMREIRNVLIHRATPGRRMYVGLMEGDAPPTEWKISNFKLTEETAVALRRGFVQNFTSLVDGINALICNGGLHHGAKLNQNSADDSRAD